MIQMTSDLFTSTTTCILYGMQEAVLQRMLDFDCLSGRSTPSVACVVNPEGESTLKAFFGKDEVLVPVYKTITRAARMHPQATVFVNFASFRSAFETTREALEQPTLQVAAIIAEGVPERRTRELIALAKTKGKLIIGPATVGGLAAGAFRIGNTGGSNENILTSKLYRTGSVGLVSKSGGLLNELCSVISRNSNGVREAIAIGGDSYPASNFMDHLLRFQANPDIALLVVLGELGGSEEYAIADALKNKKITKPLVAYVTGSCAALFPTEVQFGHAGARSGGLSESATAKNQALRQAGAVVPNDFTGLEGAIRTEYEKLVNAKVIQLGTEPAVPQLPQDYATLAGQIRKPTNFITTISDERGDDVSYAGYPLAELVEQNASLGEVLGLLWFKKKLPKTCTAYLERILMVIADHGPAVSGAHNTIVAARAGKDIVSALCSGLLTIGPRFGGAIDDAAQYFKKAADAQTPPAQFVAQMKAAGIPIPGIGHRIKSTLNPDKRVQLLKAYSQEHFKSHRYLDYALEVEKLTTAKKNNLILNVDGTIAVTLLDMMESSGQFTSEEIAETLDTGFFNGLFALGRSIGLIGHALDQKRLKQRLYRHPWDDILFQLPKTP